jgi:hypothetical protein
MPNCFWESEASPLELFSYQLDIDCFTQAQLSDMAQFLGAKERQSFIAYLLLIYDYSYDTEVDLFLFYLIQDLLFHSKLLLKLNKFE